VTVGSENDDVKSNDGGLSTITHAPQRREERARWCQRKACGKAPSCRLQLLQVWCAGKHQHCADLDFKHLFSTVLEYSVSCDSNEQVTLFVEVC
jgi:hypothetical protein